MKLNRHPIRPCLSLLALIVSGLTVPHQPAAADNPALARMREVEQQVSAVVSKNMDACVAITDGVGFGTGVIVNKSGLILTAGHVISGAGKLEVILPSGRTVKAKSLGKNLDVDSGMAQITEPGPWPFVEIADVRHFEIGQWVVSLGHSGGFELGRKPPVRTGRILSRRNHQIFTDAVLIGGDSGGPLFDLDGKLIAIHSSIGESVAENRHVTIDIFARDWDRLASGESWGKLAELNEPGDRKKPGKIGVTVDRTGPTAKITSVKRGSPAEEIGIRIGDVVIEFNKTPINHGTHLIETIKQKNAGNVFPMAILRNGKMIRFEIQLR
jgi:serine protease Do